MNSKRLADLINLTQSRKLAGLRASWRITCLELQVSAGSLVLYVHTDSGDSLPASVPISSLFLRTGRAAETASPRKPDRNARRSHGRRRARKCHVRKSREVIWLLSPLPTSDRRGARRPTACQPDQVTAAGRGSAPTTRCLSGLRVGARNGACACAFEFATLSGGWVVGAPFCHCLHLRSHCTSAGGSSVAVCTHPVLRSARFHGFLCARATLCVCGSASLSATVGPLPGRLLATAWKRREWKLLQMLVLWPDEQAEDVGSSLRQLEFKFSSLPFFFFFFFFKHLLTPFSEQSLSARKINK